MPNALVPNQNTLNRQGYSGEGIDLSLYQGGTNQSGYGLAQVDPYGRVQLGGDPGLQEYLNYLATPQTREVMGNVLADTIPASAQGRAIERLKQQWTALQNAQNPIQGALRAADMGLEGGALVADVLPLGKAAVAGGGALAALMARRTAPLTGMATAPQAARMTGTIGSKVDDIAQSADSPKTWYRGGRDVVKKDGVTFFVDSEDTARNWAGRDELSKVHAANLATKKTYDFDADPLNLQDKYKMAGPGEAGWSMDGPIGDLKKNGYDSYTWTEYAQGLPDEKNIAVFDNAAIKPTQSADSLPMDEASRMARAKEMGWRDDLYHGTNADIKKFNADKFGTNTGARDAELGVWLTNDPKSTDYWMGFDPEMPTDKGYAVMTEQNKMIRELEKERAEIVQKLSDNTITLDEYFDQSDKISAKFPKKQLIETSPGFEDGANIMPVMIRGEIKQVDYNGVYDPSEFTRIAREAEREGFDGVNFKGIMDLGESRNKHNQVLIFDPKNIRSKFAKFDPAKKNSANLLAGGAAAAFGLNALMDDRKEYVTKN